MTLIFIFSVLLGLAICWLGSPITPYQHIAKSEFGNLKLLVFSLFGISILVFSSWVFTTRNDRPLSQRELTWGTKPITDNTYIGWTAGQIRLHTKLLATSPDFSAAHPYDREAAKEMLDRHSKEMEAVRLKLFGEPTGVWVKESIEDKVKRLNKEGIPCEIVI